MGTDLLLGISFTSCYIHLTHYHITGRHRVQCFVEWRPALPWSPPSTTAPCSLTWHSSRPTFTNKTDLCIHSSKTQKLATRQVLYTMQECIRTGVRVCNSNRSLGNVTKNRTSGRCLATTAYVYTQLCSMCYCLLLLLVSNLRYSSLPFLCALDYVIYHVPVIYAINISLA